MAKGVPETHPEEKGALNWSPRANYIEKRGGLDPYVNSIAVALVRGGMTRQRAIATARNVVTKTCATGLWGGRPNAKVSPAIRARACAAAARMKAIDKGTNLAACADCSKNLDLAGPVVTSKAGQPVTVNALMQGMKPRHVKALAKANRNLQRSGMPVAKRKQVLRSMAKGLKSGKVSLSAPLADSRVVDLTFHPDELRGWHGRWTHSLDSRAGDAHLRDTQGDTHLSAEAAKAARAYVTGSADGKGGANWTKRTVSRRLRAATPKLTKGQATMVQGLDKAFEELPPTEQPLKLYRGVQHNWSGTHKLKAAEGGALADPGYMSLSTSPRVARDFAGRYGDVEQVVLPAGSKALHVNSHVKRAYGAEHEVILPRGTVVHVASIEKRLTPTVGPRGREMAEGRTVNAEVVGRAQTSLSAAARRVLDLAFNPSETRAPKGATGGGRWTAGGSTAQQRATGRRAAQSRTGRGVSPLDVKALAREKALEARGRRTAGKASKKQRAQLAAVRSLIGAELKRQPQALNAHQKGLLWRVEHADSMAARVQAGRDLVRMLKRNAKAARPARAARSRPPARVKVPKAPKPSTAKVAPSKPAAKPAVRTPASARLRIGTGVPKRTATPRRLVSRL